MSKDRNFNITHTYFNGYIDLFEKTIWQKIKYRLSAYFLSIGIFTKRLILFARNPKKNFIGKEIAKEKTWLLLSSKNNYDTLLFLSAIKDAAFVSTNIKVPLPSDNIYRLSFHRSFKYGYQIPKIFFQYLKKYGLKVTQSPDKIVEISGLFETAIEVLKKYQPKTIIFANDHIPKHRALLLAAKDLQIPTIYLQHASVSKYFPPLQFDLNLLEGKDSLEKYESIGNIKGVVHLVGMPKFDKYLSYRNSKTTISSIGICTGLIDDLKDIEQFMTAIEKDIPWAEIHFRPHPRDTRNFKLAPSIKVSDSRENIFDFLQKIDVVIGGDTSTHLEAVLLNIYSIYYKISPKNLFSDYYGYNKNGLSHFCANKEELIEHLNKIKTHKPEVYKNAAHYNALIATHEEGKSTEKSLKIINDFINAF